MRNSFPLKIHLHQTFTHIRISVHLKLSFLWKVTSTNLKCTFIRNSLHCKLTLIRNTLTRVLQAFCSFQSLRSNKHLINCKAKESRTRWLLVRTKKSRKRIQKNINHGNIIPAGGRFPYTVTMWRRETLFLDPEILHRPIRFLFAHIECPDHLET